MQTKSIPIEPKINVSSNSNTTENCYSHSGGRHQKLGKKLVVEKCMLGSLHLCLQPCTQPAQPQSKRPNRQAAAAAAGAAVARGRMYICTYTHEIKLSQKKTRTVNDRLLNKLISCEREHSYAIQWAMFVIIS